jgi:hypothetical protein
MTITRFCSLPVALATIAAGSSACSNESSQQSGVATRDSVGIRIVENSAPVWTDGQGWRIGDPILDIGGTSESDVISYIQRVIRLPNGNLVLTNVEPREWRVYDSTGRLLVRTGRVGQGPGEFETIDLVGVYGSDSLLFLDRDGGRFSVFTTDGRFVRTMPLPSFPGYSYDMLFFGDGSLALVRQVEERMNVTGPSRRKVGLYRASLDGKHIDSIGVFASTEMFTRILDNGREDMQIPFGKQAAYAFRDSLAYVGSADAFEIMIYGQTGTLHRIIRWKGMPRPVTAAMLAEYERRTAETYPPRFVEDFRRNFKAAPKPSTLPTYDVLVADEGGNLWVREYAILGEPTSWLVFNPDGRWLGKVSGPPGMEMTQIGGDFAIGVDRDEESGQRVRIYRIRK